jgi:foldase protein PrsA
MNKTIKKLRGVVGVLVLTGMITGCSAANTSAKNGNNETVVKFNQGSINNEELFNKMIETSGMAAALELADKAILNEILPVTEEMKTQAGEEMDKIKEYYGDSFKTILEGSGFKSEQGFLDLLTLNVQKNAYVTKYIDENLLSDEDIQTYYDNYEPKITASHILIKPEEDTDEAWNKALQTAKDLITKLDKGEDFAALAKENSQDPGSAVNGGDLGAFGKGQMVPPFETAAYALKVNEYTKQPVKSNFGYHIILKTKEETKGTLEEMRADIVKTLSANMLQNDNTIANKALIKMRSDNGFTINNEVIKSQYDTFVKNFSDSESNTETESDSNSKSESNSN